MPPLTVDEDEAIAMVVALNGAAQLTAGALSEASVSALSKVVQVLPPKLRRRAEALRAVTDDSPFSEAPAVHAEVLAAVAQATRDTERIRFTYRARGGQGAGEEVRRHVEPHRLVTVGRRWYLLGLRPRPAGLALVPARPPQRAVRHPVTLPAARGPGRRRRGIRAKGTVPQRDPRRRARQGAGLGRAGGAAHGTLGAGHPGRRPSCLLEMDAVHPGWAAFGLGVVDAPFTLEEATPEVLAVLRLWSARFTEAAEGAAQSG